MKRTRHRDQIIHFAGFHHLSPAIDAQGAPAFSHETGDGLTRGGWAPFFKALNSRGLVVRYDPADGSSATFVPASSPDDSEPGHGLAHAIDRDKRFLRAVFPSKSTASKEATSAS